ncbi:unnamed protein product [Pylaiella littoralis]
MGGPLALDFLIRTFCHEVSDISPTAVVFELQNLVVAEGTPLTEFMGVLRSLIQNARSVGHITPQDRTLQLAVRESVCDQYAHLTMAVFEGRNVGAVPYPTIDDIMHKLEQFAWNTVKATAVRGPTVNTKDSGKGFSGIFGGKGVSGGGNKQYNAASSGNTIGRQLSGKGRVMSVAEELEDKNREFEKVYAIAAQRIT